MFKIKGKYGEARVFASIIEQSALTQIYSILNHPTSKDAHIRIMPDVHAGKGCVVGYTAKLTDYVIPNLIGVDIGCGVISVPFEESHLPDFEKLDKFIREDIPSGQSVQNNTEAGYKIIDKVFANPVFKEKLPIDASSGFNELINETSQNTNQNKDYVMASIGTLGGGNHFIEIDRGKNTYYLTIHSGSRNFGLKVANFYQKKAKKYVNEKNKIPKEKIEEIKNKYSGKEIENQIKSLKTQHIPSGLEYLDKKDVTAYLTDMMVASLFAQINRFGIALKILDTFDIPFDSVIESVHNYIDLKDNIVRKGAISSYNGETVVIPMNMAYGIIIGKGKSNEEWNFSAPHGAGRVMSRSEAKAKLNLNDFKETLKQNGVWSNSVSYSTIDEAPDTYKHPDDIVKQVKETVEIQDIAKSVFNFKA